MATRAEAAAIGALVDESVLGIRADVAAGRLTAAEGAELLAIFADVDAQADALAEECGA